MMISKKFIRYARTISVARKPSVVPGVKPMLPEVFGVLKIIAFVIAHKVISKKAILLVPIGLL
ncbi:hypothetical protein KAT92_03405 [Candidatus Babeliales bacterium]|nr:hypothetical protein [Candidatus Babeliales bacterium]